MTLGQGGEFLHASATLMALGATRVRARVEVGGLTVFPGSHDLDGRFAFEQNGPSATIPDGRCEGNILDPMQRTGLNNSRKRLWHSSRFVCTRGRLAQWSPGGRPLLCSYELRTGSLN